MSGIYGISVDMSTFCSSRANKYMQAIPGRSAEAKYGFVDRLTKLSNQIYDHAVLVTLLYHAMGKSTDVR